MKTWILVANSAKAKIFTTESLRKGALELVSEFAHPESRKKISDLVSDRPGHFATGRGTHGAYNETDPKTVEAEHFVLQLTHELKKGWDQHQFKTLLMVTPAHFYGLLKKHLHLPSEVEELHILKDYIHYTIPELQASIKENLFV